MDFRVKRGGRPKGTGRWPSGSRVARVPACLSDSDLILTVEFVALYHRFLSSENPFQPDSVRWSAYERARLDLKAISDSLQLVDPATMGLYLGVQSSPVGGQSDECG